MRTKRGVKYLRPKGEIGPTWQRYRDDVNIPEGGLRIIGIEKNTTEPETTTYNCEYLCCGRSVVLTHKQVNRKIYNGRTNCAVCGQKIAAASSAQPPEERAAKKREREATRAAKSQPFSKGPEWPVPNFGECHE